MTLKFESIDIAYRGLRSFRMICMNCQGGGDSSSPVPTLEKRSSEPIQKSTSTTFASGFGKHLLKHVLDYQTGLAWYFLRCVDG